MRDGNLKSAVRSLSRLQGYPANAVRCAYSLFPSCYFPLMTCCLNVNRSGWVSIAAQRVAIDQVCAPPFDVSFRLLSGFFLLFAGAESCSEPHVNPHCQHVLIDVAPVWVKSQCWHLIRGRHACMCAHFHVVPQLVPLYGHRLCDSVCTRLTVTVPAGDGFHVGHERAPPNHPW